jgi:hypothetical protein
MYDVIDTIMRITISGGHTLWGALALARDRNTRLKCPGRYAVRPCAG